MSLNLQECQYQFTRPKMSGKFLLSKDTDTVNFTPEWDVHVSSCNTPCEPLETYGFTHVLNVLRDKIDKINTEAWKKVRWYINEYDFQVRDPIINRAFYKYWEIINEFDIFAGYTSEQKILHCAEAPGGFIQGTNIYLQLDRQIALEQQNMKESSLDEDGFTKVERKRSAKRDQYRVYTISLNKDLPQLQKYNLPSYNKNILNRFVYVSFGKDRTGNINNLENIDYMRTIANKDFYLITADGGFDEGTEFNNKEQLHYSLILNEIYASLKTQQRGGHFILKLFDMFTEPTVHMMYLLSLCFDQVYIYKPKTSRPTNSERYVICKGFKLDNHTRDEYVKVISELSKEVQSLKGKYVCFTLFRNLPKSFKQCIANINVHFVEKQCSFLKCALDLCNDQTFLDHYEEKLAESLEMRKNVFYEWETMYDLNAFV
jgi:23S rRNA U2552 (ribose-2'-O)-methylase RlmE/FtsJ